MPKHKLQRFQENLTFGNLFQVSYQTLQDEGFALRGNWRSYFGNDNPICLELGCGKGDYTIALATAHPECNYIGVDIKGARLWRGAKTATERQMPNVAFLRTRIELIEHFFAADEVSRIWITFPDPQPKKESKRLTSPWFLNRYIGFLQAGSHIHLKTDSQELYEYTLNEVLTPNHATIYASTNDLYHAAPCSELSEATAIQTFYETMWLAQGKSITYLEFGIAPTPLPTPKRKKQST